MFVAERHINPALSRSADETEWSENLDGFSTYHAGSTLSKDDAMSKVWSWLDIPILLSLIGLSSAMLSFATKAVLMYNANVRQYILSFIPVEFQWPAFCIYCVFMSLLACYVSQLICKESVGGGLADMKTILGGVVKPVLLSRKLIVAKTLGLWLSLMGGLSVGREGPFVHVSGAIADQLMKLEPFRHIHRQDSKRLEILACACASGVSATFGNAFGGVLFSIEFTSSAYMVRTLPKAFLTSVVAMLAFLFLGVSDELALFRDENQSIYILPKRNEMVVFFLLGLGGGLLGIVFVLLVELITTLRKALLDPKTLSRGTVELRRYVLVGAVTLLVSSAMYVELSRVPHAKRGSFGLLQFLFSADKINPDMLSSLALFGVYKFFATILSVTLPLPVGLFSPTFVIGGLLGRVLGEVLQFHPDFRGYAPWEYALLGAAAFSTGVTRAISTSVIIFELACQPHLGLPLSVVVLTAHFTGNRFSKNVYDVLVEATGGPVMDDLPESLYTVPAGSVMMPIKEHHVLALDSTYADAAALLQATEPARVGLDRHASNGIYLDSEGEVQQQAAVAFGDDTPNKHSQLGQSRELSEDGLARNTAAAASMDQASGLDRGEGVEMPSQPVAAHVVVGERQPLLASTGRQYQVKCRRLGDAQRQGTVVRHYYAPTVIPVVQSKASMVIVGAVLRKDVKEALCKLEKLREVALAAPVMLGRVEEGEVDTYGSMQQQRGSSSSWGSQGMHVISSGELGSQLLAPSADTAIFNEIIQFIIVTEGGRSIQPVVNASHKRRTHRRSISFHSLPMAIPIDPSPYQIVDTMHLSKVDMVFRLLSLNQAYVTNSGRVVGIVTRSLLREFLGGRGKRPTDRCKKFLLDMWASVCGGTPPHSQPPVLGL